jgi:radical SAM protein with 4Fe4S-binding SPASM domain
MRFKKVYIELTNICGLSCSFCPTKTLPTSTMSLDFFEKILTQLQPYTKEITFHIFGDPLTLSNLLQYLDISKKYNFKVHLVTTGYYLKNFDLNLFLHPAIKQINFSLNSFDKNDMNMTLQEYLEPILKLSDLKIQNKIESFINLRLWNLDNQNQINSFNQNVFDILEQHFGIDLSQIDYNSIRLGYKVKLDFDKYFQWPSLDSTHNTNNYCQGLDSHFGILSSGVVVPCCLDSYGIINLGNLHNQSLKDILNSKRVQNIIEGFKNNIAVEQLCKKCSYKDRFCQLK